MPKRAVRQCILAKSKNICLDSSGKVKYTAYGKKRGIKVSCESQDTDCSRCGVSCVSRYCYMSHNRLRHFKKVFFRHPPLEIFREQ